MDFALQWVGSSVNATLTHEEGELRSSANGLVEVVGNNLLSSRGVSNLHGDSQAQ